MRDLLKFAAATAAIILGYNVFIIVAAPRISFSTLTTGNRNFIIAERYLYGASPAAVIVGSSMARRLGYADDDRLGQDFYNLALDGGGPITGLSLIEAKREKPRLVVVEMNWLHRPMDQEFLGSVAGFPGNYVRTMLPAFRAEFKPLSLIAAKLTNKLNNPQPVEMPALNQIDDADPPSMPASLKHTLSLWGAITPEIVKNIESDTRIMLRQIVSLQSAGVRVVLMFMPMHPDLANSPTFAAVRAAAANAFPGDRFEWITIPDESTYHTVDSIHLTGISSHRLTLAMRAIIIRNKWL